MRHLSKHATRVAIKLFELMIDNGGQFVLDTNGPDSGIMPVHIKKGEAIVNITSGEINEVFSIAHYFEQAGQQMEDPYMEFMVSEGHDDVTPILFRQSSPYNHQNALVWEDGKVKGYNERWQSDMTYFANKWMSNIRRQQILK